MTITIIGFITGILIGTIGIGGVILVPILTYLLGMELHTVMSASSFSFLFPGIVGTYSYAIKKTIDWNKVLWISIGIVPASLIGARLNTFLETRTLIMIVAGLVIFSGIYAFYNRKMQDQEKTDFSKSLLILIGIIVGFGSPLSGTGGPVILIPILISIQYPLLRAIGISQAIQLPIAIFSVIGFWIFGKIDLALGFQLGISQAVGAYIGAQIAHQLPINKLKQFVAFSLVVVGGIMIAKIIS